MIWSMMGRNGISHAPFSVVSGDDLNVDTQKSARDDVYFIFREGIHSTFGGNTLWQEHHKIIDYKKI